MSSWAFTPLLPGAAQSLGGSPGASPVAPSFTVTQADKSASDGTTTTMTWEADGTPAPTLKVQRLGSGGGAPTLISTVILTPGSSATPGAQAITVPADAQGVVVFTRGYPAPTLSLTSNFAGTFTIVQDTGNEITSVSYAPVTSTGSKTLTPSWTTGPTEGPLFIVAFIKDIDNSSIGAWIRDSDALANDVTGSAFGLTVDSTTIDLVLAFDTQYNTGLTVPADESGWTSITTQGINSDAGRLRSADSPGASTTTATTQGTSYRGMAIVSIIGAGASWSDVTTGTNYTGSSPLTYTTPTLDIALDDGSQWRAVATNTEGSVNSTAMTLTVTSGGGQTLSPSLLTRSKTIYSPTVSVGAVSVSPTLLTRAKTLHAPTVTRGAVTLSPPLLTRAKVLYEPSVSQGGVTLSPSLLTRSKTLYAPSVSVGVVPLAPPLLTRAKTLYAPVVSQDGSTQTLTPPLLTLEKVIYAPVVVPGAVSLEPALLTRTKTIYAPTVTQGAATLTPPLLVRDKAIYAPVVTGGAVAVLKKRAGAIRRNYLIQGKRFALSDFELRMLLQQLTPARSEVQVVEKEDVKQISRKLWKRLREADSALDALTLKQVDAVVQDATIEYDEDEELVMLLL